jgi:hypothetical protein
MKQTRALPGMILVGAVAVASLFAAAPASAATLPPGQKISVIDSWDDQFYNVAPADALASPVGTPAPIEQFVTGVDVDDTGNGYAVATQVYGPDGPSGKISLPYSSPLDGYVDGGYIYKADASTGKLTDGKPIAINLGYGAPQADECSAIDYTKGVILAVCYLYFDDVELDAAPEAEVELIPAPVVAYVGTVDVSDPNEAVLTPLTSRFGDGFLYFTSIATDPVSGTVYGFDYYYPASWILPLVDNDVVFTADLEEFLVWGADFDRGGQLWLSITPFDEVRLLADTESSMELATFDFTTDQPLPIAPFGSNDPSEITFPMSITIWGVLAATGSTLSLAPAVAASGVLLLGAILAAGTMVVRRRNADA